jgi:hypothetical protein
MAWLDDIKVLTSFSVGIGNWMLHIDVILHIAISVATLFYIILRIRKLIKETR